MSKDKTIKYTLIVFFTVTTLFSCALFTPSYGRVETITVSYIGFGTAFYHKHGTTQIAIQDAPADVAKGDTLKVVVYYNVMGRPYKMIAVRKLNERL